MNTNEVLIFGKLVSVFFFGYNALSHLKLINFYGLMIEGACD